MLQAIVDLVFPPLCFCCNAKCKKSQLCDPCWELSAVIDPSSRCIHCFAESETSLCSLCRKDPWLPYPRAAVFEREAPILRLVNEETTEAIAGFAYFQWQRLDWATPDFIVPVIPSEIASRFADLCKKQSVPLFRQRFSLGSKKTELELREELIPEDAAILLFDSGCEGEDLECASRVISEAFPKRVYILSLYTQTTSKFGRQGA